MRRDRLDVRSAEPEPYSVQRLFEDAFSNDPRVSLPTPHTARFGSNGCRIDSELFAMAWQGRLAVKLSADRTRDLTSTGACLPLIMGGRTLRAWVIVCDPSMWISLVIEARDLRLDGSPHGARQSTARPRRKPR